MKTTFHLLAFLAFALLPISGLVSCGQGTSGSGAADASVAPLNEVDVLLNEYEKATSHFVKTARKMKAGDVSLTLRYIDLSKEMGAWPARLQAVAAKMTPQQKQRAAEISAKAAPYLAK